MYIFFHDNPPFLALLSFEKRIFTNIEKKTASEIIEYIKYLSLATDADGNFRPGGTGQYGPS